jgi:serine/threonine protein kinase
MDRLDNRVFWPGWETVRLLGRGSFGAVYEIRRRIGGTEERAAVKCLSIPQSQSEIDELRLSGYDEASITRHFGDLKDKLVREYSTMARLKGSANVVYCDDIRTLKHQNDVGWDVYIKMELLKPLMGEIGSGMEEKEILRLGRDIAAALASCHREKIIHRDVKPQNIFVNRDGTYKLGDFGVARTMEGTGSASVRTGTYRYMAPEVFNGRHYGFGADLYSLGLVLYWLLNDGRSPFVPGPPQLPSMEDEERARVRRFRGEPLPPPAHGSAALKYIVLRACAYDPRDRFPSAEAILDALENIDELEKRLAALPKTPAQGAAAPARNQTPLPAQRDNTEGGLSRQTPANRPGREAPHTGREAEQTPYRDETPFPAWEGSRSGSGEGRRTEPVRTPAQPRRKKKKTKRALLFVYILSLAALLLAALYLLPGRSAWNSVSDPSGGRLKWKVEDGTLTLAGSGAMADYGSQRPPWSDSEFSAVVIEEGVTSVGANAFSSSAVVTVSLPESLTVIGDHAFEGCTELLSVNFPRNLRSIGERAFYRCSKLSYASIPAGVSVVGRGAFSACGLPAIEVQEGNAYFRSVDGVLFSGDGTELICYPGEKSGIHYTVPEGVTAIGDYAFSMSARLSSVSLPDTLTGIGEKSFEMCQALNGVKLPESLETIGELAFYNCVSLSSVTIPAGVVEIGNGAFSACGLSAIEVQEGNAYFRTAEGVLFSSNGTALLCYPAARNQKSYAIPAGVSNIEDFAFCDCSVLEEITVTDGVSRIGAYGFFTCPELAVVRLPLSLNSIGENAFSGCGKLTRVLYAGGGEQWANISLGQGNEALTRGAIDFNVS